MKSIKPYLKRMALDSGILKGNQNYVKFIILSRSRAGSEYLRSLLNSHSQITVYGELFQHEDHINWNYPDVYRSEKRKAMYQEKPLFFLEEEIFRTYPSPVEAVGFKIFYYHAQNDSWKVIWPYLQNQKDLKIIHLKRKNILRTHLSRKRAMATGKWINLTGEKEEAVPIQLSYDECLNEFIKTRGWEQQYGTFFKNHDQIEIIYENLSNHASNEMQCVQRFLGVKEEELKSITHRQVIHPLPKIVANYYELKEQFQNSPWTEFFEE